MTPPSSTPPPSPYDSGPTPPPPSPFGNNPTPPSNPLSPNSAPESALPWYAQTWATVVALVLFAPAGVFLMWKYRTWQQKPKVIATIVSLLFFLGMLPKSPDKAATRTASISPAVGRRAKQTAPDERPTTAPKAVAPGDSPRKGAKKPAPTAPAPKAQSDSKPLFAQDADAQPESAQAPAEDSPRNVEVVDIPNVGQREVGIVNDVGYAVLEVEKVSSISSPIGTTQAGGAFFILTVRAFNDDKKTHNVTTGLIKLLDDQDREFDASSAGASALQMAGEDRIERFSVQLQPGITKEFVLIYDAPDDASGLRLKIPAKSFSLSTDAIIKLPKQSG